MRTILAVLALSSVVLSMSPYDDAKVFGDKFGMDFEKLLSSFVRHTERYGWFLKDGLDSLSNRALLEGSFWVEYVCYYYGASYRESYELVVPLVLMGDVVDMASMISIIVVETRFRNTVGDEGKAFGYYQIHVPTALNALEFVNSNFPDIIWKLPLRERLIDVLKDLVERPGIYKNNPAKFGEVMLKNRPIQSVIAGLVYLHKAFMAGKRRIRTDSMKRYVDLKRYVVLSPTDLAPVYWNSANWLHYAPLFYYHYSKALTAYTRFLKDYLGIETRGDYEKALELVGRWRKKFTGIPRD